MKSESGWTPIDEFDVSADNTDQNRLNQPPNHVNRSSEIYGLRTKFVFTSNLDCNERVGPSLSFFFLFFLFFLFFFFFLRARLQRRGRGNLRRRKR